MILLDDMTVALSVLALPVGWGLGIVLAELGFRYTDRKRARRRAVEMAGPHPLSEELTRRMCGGL